MSNPVAYAPPRPSRSGQRGSKRSMESNDDFVIVDPYHDNIPDSRPSYASEMGESNMSHDPLLPSYSPSSRYEKPVDAQDQRLTTVNKLNPAERAALVRQTRKIHKVLGATPQIAEMVLPPRSSGPNRLQRRPTLAGSDIRLDRSAALAAMESPRLEPPPGSNWGKMASSLVATSPTFGTNSNVPLMKLNIISSPNEDSSLIRPRRLSDSSIASSSINSILSLRRGSGNLVQEVSSPNPDVAPPTKSKLSSSKIYIPPSPTSPPPSRLAEIQRQQSRARMAKVQQLMGEAVPSELVMGPEPRKRRLSMESRIPNAPPAQHALKHKRSRSMWKAKDLKDTTEFDSAPETTRTSKGHGRSKSRTMPPIEDLLLKQLQHPMSEKQKQLNVKRALKMAAVFGVPPPQVLYQDRIGTQQSPSFDSVASRQSLANLAYMLDHDRDSLYDLLANATDSGSDSDDDPVEWPYEHKPRSDSLQDTNAPRTPAKGSAKYTIAGRYPDMAPPTPPFRGSFEEATREGQQPKFKSSRPPPLTIYSTSTSVSTGQDGAAKKMKRQPSTPKSPASEVQFSARRRRANKLSRFFGVGYNDLWNIMIYGAGADNNQPSSSLGIPPVPPLPTTSPITPKSGPSPSNSSRTNLAVPGSSTGLTRNGTVLVQTDTGKATVLRTSANLAADVDVEDLGEVMARLRALKA